MYYVDNVRFISFRDLINLPKYFHIYRNIGATILENKKQYIEPDVYLRTF